MKYETYELTGTGSAMEFTFTSKGPKGAVRKIVQFNETPYQNLYVLAFGDSKPDGSFDDKVNTNNNDMRKVIATVVKAVRHFTLHYPNSMIYFTGSAASRTNLYRLAITKNLDELSYDFEISGYKNGNLLPFQPGTDYEGFIIQRRLFL